MGGLGPGIGGSELFVIGLVALLVVGPKDLPVLMRRVGKAMAKFRAMAADFRASFDEMARQSELDELRKEVEALRTGQSGMYPLGAEADAAFKGIRDDLNAPLISSPAAPSLPSPEGWSDTPPILEPVAPAPKPRKPRAKAAASTAKPKTARKVQAEPAAKPPAPRKPRAPKASKADL